MGHRVRIASWYPGGHVWPTVTYGRPRNVPTWAHASDPHSTARAAINMSTWTWRTNVPIGTVRARGRWITPVRKRPAVGFRNDGSAIFGAQAAAQNHVGNIASGVAYLVRSGHVVHRYPWAHPAQRGCPCWRSVVAQWPDGRVGLVEVAYASMPTAARLLHGMGVRNALAGDAGGSSVLWTHTGWGGCAGSDHAIGECMGVNQATGIHYERPVPVAIVAYRLHGGRQ